MDSVIYKYSLRITDTQVIPIVGLIKVLSVTVQRGVLVLYAVRDTADDVVSNVRVIIRGTGNNFSMLGEDCFIFRGTHLIADDNLVWHVWTHEPV